MPLCSFSFWNLLDPNIQRAGYWMLKPKHQLLFCKGRLYYRMTKYNSCRWPSSWQMRLWCYCYLCRTDDSRRYFCIKKRYSYDLFMFFCWFSHWCYLISCTILYQRNLNLFKLSNCDNIIADQYPNSHMNSLHLVHKIHCRTLNILMLIHTTDMLLLCWWSKAEGQLLLLLKAWLCCFCSALTFSLSICKTHFWIRCWWLHSTQVFV